MKILKKGTWLKYYVKKYCKTKEHWHIQEKSNFVISKNIVETLPLRPSASFFTPPPHTQTLFRVRKIG